MKLTSLHNKKDAMLMETNNVTKFVTPKPNTDEILLELDSGEEFFEITHESKQYSISGNIVEFLK
jgi:hypothetical protein